MLTLTNEDNMAMMARYPDKHFDLALVDPPYGINVSLGGCGCREKKYNRTQKNNWDKETPSDLYWSELFRISKNQIVFGMNNFSMPKTQHFIVWDKKQPDGVTFAQAELLWTSFLGSSKIVRMSANGQDNRFHPTQKPVALYRLLLKNYAKEGDKILDTNLGSGSIAIACHEMGFDLTGCELDKNYFDSMNKRLEPILSQGRLFNTV